MRDRNATPILDAVRRQRGESFPYGKPAPVDPWAPAPTPDQLREADRLLAGAPVLKLKETDHG